jgi:hypothetical protein
MVLAAAVPEAEAEEPAVASSVSLIMAPRALVVDRTVLEAAEAEAEAEPDAVRARPLAAVEEARVLKVLFSSPTACPPAAMDKVRS